MVSTFVIMPTCTIFSWNVLYDRLTEKEKIEACFTNCSSHYTGTNQKWLQQYPFVGKPQMTPVNKYPHNVQNFRQYTQSYILFGRRNG
jgi:surface antigen